MYFFLLCSITSRYYQVIEVRYRTFLARELYFIHILERHKTVINIILSVIDQHWLDATNFKRFGIFSLFQDTVGPRYVLALLEGKFWFNFVLIQDFKNLHLFASQSLSIFLFSHFSLEFLQVEVLEKRVAIHKSIAFKFSFIWFAQFPSLFAFRS